MVFQKWGMITAPFIRVGINWANGQIPLFHKINGAYNHLGNGASYLPSFLSNFSAPFGGGFIFTPGPNGTGIWHFLD